MELYEGLLTRRSIRKYNPEKKLTKDEILELVRAASYAPSAHNKQPWHFLVIQDAETLRTLRQIQPWTSFAKMRPAPLSSAQTKKSVSTAKKRGGTMPRLTVHLRRKTCCWPAMPKGWAPVSAARHRCRWSLTTCVKSSVCRKRCSPWQSLPSVIRKKHPNSRKTGLTRKRCTGKRFNRNALGNALTGRNEDRLSRPYREKPHRKVF